MTRIILIFLFCILSQFFYSQNTILWKITDTINHKTTTIIGTYHQFGNSFVDSIPKLKEALYKADLAIFEAMDTHKIISQINQRKKHTFIRFRNF